MAAQRLAIWVSDRSEHLRLSSEAKFQLLKGPRPYSFRSAIIGSTRDARRAEMKLASAATINRMSDTTAAGVA